IDSPNVFDVRNYLNGVTCIAASDCWSVGDWENGTNQTLIEHFTATVPTVVGAASRKTHGIAGNFDIDLPLTGATGVECRSGGSTNDFTMVATFSSNVTVTGSPQAQVTLGTGTVGSGGVSNGGMV